MRLDLRILFGTRTFQARGLDVSSLDGQEFMLTHEDHELPVCITEGEGLIRIMARPKPGREATIVWQNGPPEHHEWVPLPSHPDYPDRGWACHIRRSMPAPTD